MYVMLCLVLFVYFRLMPNLSFYLMTTDEMNEVLALRARWYDNLLIEVFDCL